MHYYQFNIGDYVSSTAHLEPLEDIAFRRMLDLYYSSESPLPNDVEFIARKIRMRSHCECIADVLQEFFELDADEEYWHCTRADNEIAAFNEKANKASEAAKKRWGNKKPAKTSERSTGVMRTQCERNADAMRTHTERNANHKPLTINQEPSNKTIDHFAERESDPPPDSPVVAPDEIDEAFNVFWFAGMRKLNKKKSFSLFKTALKNSKQAPMEFALMLADDVKRRLAVGQLGFADLHPSTYLNGQRWEDEIRPPSRASPNGRESMADQLTREAREREEFYATGITPEGVQVTQW